MSKSNEMISGLSFAGNISSLFSAKTISSVNQATGSFSDYMKNSSNTTGAESFIKTKNSSVVKEYEKVSGNSTADQRVKKAEVKKDKTADTTKVSKDSKDIEGSDTVKEVTKKVKEVVKKQLELSEEDFQKVMETLGFTMVDLLNMDNLKKMLLQVNGSLDATDLLTNESLNESLNELLEEVSKILESADITSEQILNFESEMSSYETAEESDVKAKAEVSEISEEEMAEDVTETEIAFSVIKEEGTANESSSDESFRQSGNSGQEMTNQFLDNMIGSMAAAQTEMAEEMNAVQELKEIARQIIDEIKVVIKPGTTSMELDLNPDHLGKVRLNIESQAGGLTAKFTAESEVARQAIESSIQTLRETLESQGIKVEKIEVLVSDFSFAGSSQSEGENGQGSKNKNRTFRTEEELMSIIGTDKGQSEEIVQVMDGTSIDYSA